MENYEDFYCCECKYYTVLYNKKRETERSWCEKQAHPVSVFGAGCPFFELEEEDDE